MKSNNKNIFIAILSLCIALFSLQAASATIDSKTIDSKLKLLLISSNIIDTHILAEAVKENVIVVPYDHEKTSLNQLILMVRTSLSKRKVSSIGIATHNHGANQFYITQNDIISIDSTLTDLKQQKFWLDLCDMLVENGRIDLFACDIASNHKGQRVIAALESLTNRNFAASNDLTGNGYNGGNWLLETDNINLSDEYFSFQKLNKFTGIFATFAFTDSDIIGDERYDSKDVAIGDVDNDGDLDIYVVNATYEQNKLWINDGSGNFVANDIADDIGRSYGVAMGDVNNDGYLDIYVANYNDEQNKLWINNGDGSFTANNISGDTGSSNGAVMGDIDNDGDLDIYVANYAGQNKLWINDGTGVFTNNDITDDEGNSFAAVMGDVNNDGNLDIYVADNTKQNKLWINNGDGSFTANNIAGDIGSSTGAVMGDIDNDGDLDIYTINYGRNILWINNGVGSFTANSIADDDIDKSRGAVMGDIDNDGDLDIYVAQYDNQQNRLWINDGTGSFTANDIADDTGMSTGAAMGDIDNDGDIDIYVANYGLHNKLWKQILVKDEPQNHPTRFNATANSASQITTSWTDSIGETVPDGYLIMCSTSDSFTDPVDGTAQSDDTDCSDGSGIINITQGTGTYSWTGLDSNTQYYFKIFSYTNSDIYIDYKTDGSPATDDATTLLIETLDITAITPDPATGHAPLSVDFEVTVTGGTLPYTYSWDFDGDGVEDSTLENPSYTYTVTGNYSANITVTDANENTASKTQTIQVLSEDDCVHSMYDSGTMILTIPYLDIPLLDPITQQDSGRSAVFECKLKLVQDSVGNFSVEELTYLEDQDGDSVCHASYSYDGTMFIPNVDVITVVILPPDIIVQADTQTYDLTLKQLPISTSIFNLETAVLKE